MYLVDDLSSQDWRLLILTLPFIFICILIFTYIFVAHLDHSCQLSVWTWTRIAGSGLLKASAAGTPITCSATAGKLAENVKMVSVTTPTIESL